MILTCPKCKGTGDVGVISNMRCGACKATGEIEVKTQADEDAYDALVQQYGPIVDDGLLGDSADYFDDGIDDEELLWPDEVVDDHTPQLPED
jgi:hypothetical protein